MLVHADRLSKRKIKENDDQDLSFPKRVARLSYTLAVKFRTSSNDDKINYNFAINLLNQALVCYNLGLKSESERLLNIGRRFL